MVVVETRVVFCELEDHTFCVFRGRVAEAGDYFLEHARVTLRARHPARDSRRIGDGRGKRQKTQPRAELIRIAELKSTSPS